MKYFNICIFIVFFTVSNSWAVDADSTTWEGYYEADAFPHDVSAVPATSSGEIFLWSDDGGAASVGGGLLSINTMGMNEVAVWSGAGGGLSPSLDFVTGSSFEIRFRINAVDGDGGAMQLRFSDSAGNRLKGEISPGSYGFFVSGEGTVSSIPGLTPTSADSSWHILRFTMNGLGAGGLTTYLDNNPVPESVVWLGNTGIANELTFGDATGGNDADWDIDYMRWTAAGAFAPPAPPTVPVTDDSTTWEGHYEADDFPNTESGIPLDTDPGFPNGFSSVSGGLLNLNTLGSDSQVVWGWAPNSLLPAMDFSAGASFEIRFRTNAVDGDGGMAIEFSDSSGNNIRGEWSPGGGGWFRNGLNPGLAAPFLVPDPATFHTLRFVISDLAVGGLKLYLDGNPTAVYTDEVVDAATVNRIWLGDPTSTFDADWDIDYIRWTGAGAFVPPPPPPPDPATTDSTTWEGHYEADDFPNTESGIPLDTDPGFPNGFSSVSGGLLNLNTLGSDSYVVWGATANSLFPAMDFSDGATFEIRAKVNVVDGDGGMAIEFSDSSGNNIRGEWSPGGGGWFRNGANSGLAAPFLVPDPNVFHTIRFVISNLDPNDTGLSIYLDGDPTPTYTDQVVDTATVNRIWLGDPTGLFDADWDIDYIRWTDQGAFAPPEPPGLCGDLSHPYPVGDFTKDCVVDSNDLIVLVSDWLQDISTTELDPSMRDSANWAGFYEGDAFPDADGSWAGGADYFNIAFPSLGSLRMDSFNFNWSGFYDLDVPPLFDFDDGVSVEFSARMDIYEGGGAAQFQVYDVFSREVSFGLRDDGISINGIGNYLMDTTDGFHTYRLTISRGSGQVRLYVPDDSANLTPDLPVLEGTLDETPNGILFDLIRFGDQTGPNDADWRLDYIRWTKEGDFPLPGTPAICGDPANPLPESDQTGDCFVNYDDFGIFSLHWAEDTRP